jgi:hypothetical protein
MLSLEVGTAIEDYCLYPDIFLRAVEETVKGSYEALSKQAPQDLEDQIKKSWAEFQSRENQSPSKRAKKPMESPEEGSAEVSVLQAVPAVHEIKTERNAGSWFNEFTGNLPLIGGSSKVALARNYAFLARENPIRLGLDEKKVELAKALLAQVVDSLKLPGVRAKKTIET